MRLRALALTGPTLVLLLPAGALAAWSGPAPLTPADGAAYAVPHAAAEGGRMLAAWVRAPAGTRGRAEVHVATRPAGPAARWTPARRLSGPGVDAPRVALNPRGDAAVVWVKGRRLVAAVRRGPGGAWSRRPVADAGAGVQATRLVIDRVGRPTVMWSERAGDGFLVRVATRVSPRAGWALRPPRLRTPGPDPPALALGRAGALVAWSADGGVRASRTAAGAFERPVELGRDAGAPAVALSGGGAALGAWGVSLPGGTPVVLAAVRPPGSDAWSGSDDVGIGLRAVAGINDRGDAVVAWSLDEPGSPQGVEAALRRGGRGGWRASTVVPRRGCECRLAVGGAAVDGRGAALVSWRRDDGGPAGAGGAASQPPGETDWSRVRMSPGRMSRAPEVAADGGSGGVAVWVEAGPGSRVRAAALRP